MSNPASRANGLPRQPTFWTKKRLVLGLGLLFAAGIVAAALDLQFGFGGKPRRVEPNSLLVLDPDTLATIRNPKGPPLPSAPRFARGAGWLWVVNGPKNQLLAIEPQTQEVARRLTVGNDPVAVTVGYGAAWVASAGNGTVTRVPLAGGKAEAIELNDQPSAIDAGANAVWVVSTRGKAVIRIDPRTREVTKTIRLANPPESVMVGLNPTKAGGRAVWITIGG